MVGVDWCGVAWFDVDVALSRYAVTVSIGDNIVGGDVCGGVKLITLGGLLGVSLVMCIIFISNE